MSINDQALADLEAEGILQDDLPIQAMTNAPKSVSVLDTPLAGSTQTPLTDDLKRRLLSPQTEYKSVVAGVERVTDMEALQQSIATAPAVSFADAQEVAMTFESFTKQISLKEFTKAPSKVNKAFTDRFMEVQLKLKKEQVGTVFENFVAGPLADVKDSFSLYKDFYGKNLLEELQTLQAACARWLLDSQSISRQIFQTGQDFVNFATIPLQDIPTKKVASGPEKLFLAAIDNLQAVGSKGAHTQALVRTVAERGSFTDFVDPRRQVTTTPLTALDYLKLFGDVYLITFFVRAEALAGDGVKALNDLKENAQVNPTDFIQVRDFIVSNGQNIEGSNNYVHHYLELMELLRCLVPNVSVVLDYFTVATPA